MAFDLFYRFSTFLRYYSLKIYCMFTFVILFKIFCFCFRLVLFFLCFAHIILCFMLKTTTKIPCKFLEDHCSQWGVWLVWRESGTVSLSSASLSTERWTLFNWRKHIFSNCYISLTFILFVHDEWKFSISFPNRTTCTYQCR